MHSTEIQGRDPWRDQPFYRFLFENFPTYRSKRGLLDVPRIAKDVGLTAEGIYKWLRRGVVTPTNARTLHRLCNAPTNIAALQAIAATPPALERFYEFCE
ncbi:hypothetical protein [Sphingopyxis sp. GW247-27LB]|uniref:hypothetical protein n=1 Tax=Sphingopyxis sp. GW247-27LB TaxID=2012632 RepID=UPI000BA77B2E|nr:hypothetical protein [Sphingopyxis sp. GW247-27LB]PAL23593.1 hypothetical protein CD928_05865 [Sphingopyxis sp. GW247-27LB]